MGDHLAVGGEQGEPLVDHSIGGAERADLTVPAARCIASVLHEIGPDPRLPAQKPELSEGDVADAEQARPAAVADRFHGAPGLPIDVAQEIAAGRTVQHVAINNVVSEMRERAWQRLLDPGGDGDFQVVGQAVALPAGEGELGL